MPPQQRSHRVDRYLPGPVRGPRAVPEPFRAAAENPAGSPGSRFARSGGDGLGWEDGGMPDAIPLVDLASLA
jgi:hypothetical protein